MRIHALITDAFLDREGNQCATAEISAANLKVIEELIAALVLSMLPEKA